MDTAYDVRPGRTAAPADPADGSHGQTAGQISGPTRARLEQQLSPWLSAHDRDRLWAEAWELTRVTPWTLWGWLRTYGEEVAALAVAAGLTEGQLQRHLKDGRIPDRAVLEMLADLNCFPHVTPAARV
jgi:hypothetical protein